MEIPAGRIGKWFGDFGDQIKGKTVAFAELDTDVIAIVFTDGTWFYGEPDDDDNESLMIDWTNDDPCLDQFLKMGLITQEQYDAEDARLRVENAESMKEYKIAEFNRLKAELGL
jgi:hypothetical protein